MLKLDARPSWIVSLLAMLLFAGSATLSIAQPAAPADAPETPATNGEQPPAPPATEAEDEPETATEDVPMVDVVGWLELKGALREGPLPFSWVSPDDVEPSLTDILNQLDTVASGEQYLGMVIHLDAASLTLTQVNAITERMQRVRDAGKSVLVFAESYGMMDYLLASHADLILLQHKGGVALTGLAMEEMYLAGLLEKIGAKADMMQVGKYKGASEQMARTGPSDEWNKNFDALLDDLYGQIVDHIAEGRKMESSEVEALFAKTLAMTDVELLRNRVVDRLVERDLVDVTEIEFGDGFVWDDSMGHKSAAPAMDSPFALFQML
ncbi:MAG: S49 family peptidase, partial [Rhodospirillales bacterium]|nr:S49 family peptidase [Rhodospirillales bacterium]